MADFYKFVCPGCGKKAVVFSNKYAPTCKCGKRMELKGPVK